MKSVKQELRSMDKHKLEAKVDELRRELFKLRLQGVTSPSATSVTVQRQLKKNIARALTILREQSQA